MNKTTKTVLVVVAIAAAGAAAWYFYNKNKRESNIASTPAGGTGGVTQQPATNEWDVINTGLDRLADAIG